MGGLDGPLKPPGLIEENPLVLCDVIDTG